MIDMSKWPAHHTFLDGLFAFLLAAAGIACLLRIAWRVGSRIRHRGEGGCKPLLSDERFTVTLMMLTAIVGLFVVCPQFVAALTSPSIPFVEQVRTEAGLSGLSCPMLDDSTDMPRQGRYACEYVDGNGRAHDMSLLVASGGKIWLYDANGKILNEGGDN